MGNPTDKIRARLDELGVEYDTFDPVSTQNTYWNVGELRFRYCERKGGTTELTMFAKCDITPEQAIAATVGMEKWEPSKEWKAWHNSLKHDNPTSIREAVENILYEAIDFGGDMGPNGNVWSGVDEGIVLTENCIGGWVESVESIVATVGADEDETDARALIEAIRDDDGVRYSMDEVLDIMRKDVAATVNNAGYGIQFADWCEFPPETMVGETVFDGEGNAIGWIVNATVGAGTCKRVYHPNRLARNCTCSNCGYGASDERWAYCPKCGHKYVHGEVEERWKKAGMKVAE